MDIEELTQKAYEKAKEHGFWEDEQNIITKMCVNNFSINEVKAVKRAFMCQRLMSIVTEVGEAANALRNDDKKNYGEELADIVLRVASTSRGDSINLKKEIQDKMEINKSRPYKHGKTF